jgi:hypothetical protein
MNGGVKVSAADSTLLFTGTEITWLDRNEDDGYTDLAIWDWYLYGTTLGLKLIHDK